MAINPAPEYHKKLAGFSGIKRAGTASKQINGVNGPSNAGDYSAKTAADNASFDRSRYQKDVQKSMVGGHLR